MPYTVFLGGRGDLFYRMTWGDFELDYGHKALVFIQVWRASLQVSVTLSMPINWHCLRLTSIFCSPSSFVSNIFTYKWPVTSSVTSRSIFLPCSGSSRTGLSNSFWNLEIGPVVCTGGVSYTVGGAVAPPTLSSATPTVWLATPIFNGFWSFPASKCSR